MKLLTLAVLLVLSVNAQSSPTAAAAAPTAAAPTAAGNDDDKKHTVTSKDGKIFVKFLGASGGMKISASGKNRFLEMKQNKLVEFGSDGKKKSGGFSMNVAGQNSWSDLKQSKDSNDVTQSYSTTFTAAGNGKSSDAEFSLTAHVAVSEVTVQDMVPCQCGGNTPSAPTAATPTAATPTAATPTAATPTAATPTAATPTAATPTAATPTAAPGRRLLTTDDKKRKTCKKEDNGSKQCVSDTGGVCPTGFTMCTKDVKVQKNELKFSFILTGVDMADGSTLRYGLELVSNDKAKSKKGRLVDKPDKKAKKDKELKIESIGLVTMPTTASITNGNTTRDVDVTVTFAEEGGKSIVGFEFPAIKAGESLYYDPAADLADDSDSDGAAMMGVSAVTVGVLIASILL